MNRNKKIFLAALSVMMVMAVSIAILSFTRASQSENGSLTEGNVLVTNNIDTNTNIDNIIEFSHGAGAEEIPPGGYDESQIYKIVEIGSSATPSTLKEFVENNGFENYVVNGNRTISDLMNANCIRYNYYQANQLSEDSAGIADKKVVISNADFIYVTYDPNTKYNAANNDISDSVLDIMKKHAMSDYKPLIIDSPTELGSGVQDEAIITTNNVIEIYNGDGKYYYTFSWDKNLTAVDFVNHQNGSLFLPIGGSAASSRWYTYVDPDNADNSSRIARMLVVTEGGTTNDMKGKLVDGITAVDLNTVPSDPSIPVDPAINPDDYKGLYPVGNTDNLYSLYSANGAKPNYIKFDTVSIAELEAAGAGYSDNYDLIIMESDITNKVISKELYSSLVGALYAKKNIIYDKDILSTSSSGNEIALGDLKDTNYYELFASVASSDDEPFYDNVMVSNRNKIGIICGSNSAETCKIIADLINKSAFRGIGGQGSSSNLFTVLELQPCYPIDEDVAQANNNYYTVPSDVLKGKTKEELTEGTEYYAFELSKAKIAHALGLNADQINLVQMSTEEFATYKDDILGNYDLIYIGGNTSAMNTLGESISLVSLMGWNQNLSNFTGNKVTEAMSGVPMYGMYTHSGTIVNVDLSPMGDSGGPVRGGTPTANVVINGSSKSSFSMLNGNDITFDRYEQLEKYINAGMPVIVSNDASVAYEDLLTLGKQNQKIDPDSNMAKVIGMCYSLKDDGTNVSWGFDQTSTVSVNANEGNYGNSLTGKVTVFDDANKGILNSLYTNSSKRPKLTLLSSPTIYNEYDSASIITDGNMTFKYKLSGIGSNSSVELYIDDDGNSKFTAEENVQVFGSSTELKYQLADSFYGPVYWMIKVTDNTTKSTVSTKGISYVKNDNAEVQNVRVLQIMPGENAWGGKAKGEGAEGSNSLYLCTVCQQAYLRLDYNAYENSTNKEAVLYAGNYEEPPNGILQGYYLGRHEHNFGIVKYDSSIVTSKGLGADDWDTNFADDIGDKFDFDIDIMLRNEFEDAAKEVAKEYNFSGMSEKDKKDIIDKFAIDQSDIEYAKYTAIADTDLDGKLAFIKSRENKELSAEYWQKYEFMRTQKIVDADSGLGLDSSITKTSYEAELEVREALELMITNIQTGNVSGGQGFNMTNAEIIAELNRMLDSGLYADFFSINDRKELYNNVSVKYLNSNGLSFRTIYSEYAKYKDIELGFYDSYKKYERLANPDNWIGASYDTVVIGASEDFAADDITDTNALNALKVYIEKDGQMILFHDTLTKFTNAGTSTLTSELRSYFGLDRYNMEMDASASNSTNYVPYKVKSNYEDERYFMTSLLPGDGVTNATWLTNIKTYIPNFNANKYLTNVAYTDAVQIGRNSGGTNKGGLPYKYAELEWKTASFWYNAANFSAKANTSYGTDRATQNNKGIVTMYPFTLGDKLNISGTHSQAYALDLESDDTTVWYSLAGGTNTKDGSSLYAASPNDGMDSYFIYTYKNVNYCGAGHSNVTGIGKDNNDERRLYINIICNSVRKSTKQPTIYIYDYEKDTYGDKIKRDNTGMYYTKVDDFDGYTEFSFKVNTDPETILTNVKVYFDLDYSLDNQFNNYVDNNNHVLIADWNSNQVEAGKRKDVYKYDPTLKLLLDADGNQITDTIIGADGVSSTQNATTLKLLPKYFEPYNNEYTYIVIAATDSTGNVVYQRIKIRLTDVLFNLT